jgi:hypothetical protein
LLLTYPNQKWEKSDFNTTWNLSPAILFLLGEMVKDHVEVRIINAKFCNLIVEQFIEQVADYAPD